jgi:hypothetical protein
MSGGAKGIGLGIDFAIGNQYKRKGGKSYIDPAVLSSVVSVISTYGKTNEDADRSILKDKTGKGNDFKLLNFGFAGNSGYGLYSTDFTKWTKRQINDLEVSPNKISVSNKDSETALVIWLDVNKNRYVIPSYKIKVSKLTKTITYYYIDEANPSIRSTFFINKEGTYILPISRNDLYNGEENTNIGFGIFPHESFTIEQLPDFEGWLYTDGVDDMIVSEKTVGEMIGDSKECTVISIINYISDIAASTNIFGRRYIRNSFIGNGIGGKYYICGYTSKNIDERGNVTVINDILGDKNDFSANYVAAAGVADYFSVTGYLNTDNVPQKCIKIAYAGGFIANKVLTTDEINQIIAYFNLDCPGQIIKPQLYCNIKKQGITNDNHAEFNDQLIDFVGGHNIQLNNIGWEGESGIGSYPVVLGINKTFRFGTQWEVSNSGAKMSCVDIVDISLYSLYYNVKNPEGGVITTEIPSFTIKVSGITDGSFGYLRYGYLAAPDAVAITEFRMTADGTYTLPKCYGGSEALDKSKSCYVGFSVEKTNVPGSLIIEVLPTIENALCLDGISDFGKATGLPVLKDYTICALRKWLYGDSVTSTETGSIVSKSKVGNDGAFILEQTFNRNPSRSSTFSFGTINSLMSNDKLNEESFTYQTKYSYNGETIVSGSGVDSDSMWLGTIRDGDSRFSKFALRSLMLFSYSLSEFLLERQLRKYKAGTLYPDMIEWRPIVKSNIESYTISFYLIDNHGNQLSLLENGKYYDFSDKNRLSLVKGVIKLDNEYIDSISSVKANGIKVDINDGSFYFPVTKSPQKIDITIDRKEVLSNIKNSTWISNEQLIKNK